ncbi:PREDICTED: protein CPR-5 [Camelina sativa]|uniref:Protein CPR-5 n=1 Tax=Camelina sativa TaxID=90675 RepID=A0ABM0XDH2_CAMSA|nr:PREDICTED: protein CPR-5 [Camelina sativa]
MEALLLLSSSSPEPQNPITDPANSKSNHKSDEEVKDETVMMKKKKKKTKQSDSEKRKLKGKKKEMNNDAASSSSCSISSTSNSNSTRRVSRVAHRLRNPTVRLGMSRRSVGERQAEALAFPLGMSFAALANLVLQRKNAAGQNVFVDDLAMISARAATETVASVYGYKLGSFATTFEKSFNHTLRILKVTNESANPRQLNNDDVGRCNLDCSIIDEYSDTELSAKETSSSTSAYEVIQGSAIATTSMNELVLHEASRQLSCLPPSSSEMPYTAMLRFIAEKQQEANDLQREAISLKMIGLTYKEVGLGLKHESNNLQKSQLEMDVSKAAFKKEKFKTELEETRKAEMVRRVMDWLGVSVFSMSVSMLTGAYNFSLKRIEDATAACEPSEETSSTWWVPKHVSTLNSEFNTMICRIRVWVQFVFGLIMLLVLAYFIMQRSSGRTQAMPISFIVIVLGIFCGLPVKVCVDTLGGDGKLWLMFWEVFCLFHLFANVFTLTLYGLMYGPIINVTQVTKSSRFKTLFPYGARRSVLYVVFIFVLPAITGLLPFATFGEWRDLAMDNFFGGSASDSKV